MVGAADSREKTAGQDGVRFTPLPRARQQEAVRFLNENAFRTPTYFMDEQILRRIEVEGALDRIRSAQTRVLARLLDDPRMDRMIEFEALARNGRDVYPLADIWPTCAAASGWGSRRQRVDRWAATSGISELFDTK